MCHEPYDPLTSITTDCQGNAVSPMQVPQRQS